MPEHDRIGFVGARPTCVIVGWLASCLQVFTDKMRCRLIRMVAIAGVTFAAWSAPVFLSAQVRKEAVDPVPTTKAVTKESRPIQPAERMRVGVTGRVVGSKIYEQWARQFRPILRVEYLFVRTVCDPSKNQRILIAHAGLKALDEAATDFVDWQTNRRLRVQPQRDGARPGPPDARRSIQEALAVAVKAHLSPAQFERYRVEAEARMAEQKRVAILSFVAKLDQAIDLIPKQRDEIRESLSSHWDETWAKGLQNYNIDDQYVPMVPDQLVISFLDDEQKSAWKGTQKFSAPVGSVLAGVNMDDGPLDEEFPDELAREDPKPETKK